SGDNGTGKTSVFDAFTFLLFGKDSSDRKDFNIKPLNANGLTTDKLECEVSAVLDASGIEMTLKRVFREKWQKKKGEETPEFVGNETLYYWNDVPLQQKEYMSKIETLVDENVFKLITNPLYFNTLKWQDRRSVLLGIAGSIADAEVLDSIATLSNKSEIFNLTNVLNQGKTLAEYKKEISAKKKKANDDLKVIPSRIDEAVRSKPESENFDAIRKSIERLKSQITEIDEQIADKSKSNSERLKKLQEKQNQLYDLKSQLRAIEHTVQEDIRDKNRKLDEQPVALRREISNLESDINHLDQMIRVKKDSLTKLESSLQPTREEWEAENGKELTFDESEFHCPTCKREYESSDIEETKERLTHNFNESKVNKLGQLREKGLGIKNSIQEVNEVIAQHEKEKQELSVKLQDKKQEFHKLATSTAERVDEKTEVQQALLGNSDYASLTVRINDLQTDIDKSGTQDESSENDQELKTQKSTLMTQVGDLYTKLSGEEQIQKIDKRIEELKTQEKSLAQLIADYDGSEFIIDAYTKAKMNIMESRINSKFKMANFRMFKQQVNGGEEETCDTTYNGVPWSDLNTAAKIQVGIDIINALSDFYNVNAPIWIDNRESTVRIPDTESQVINLVVREGSDLRVSAPQLQLAEA
ncbi:MAG TPA: hypothetical protein VGN64_25450, partial [Dyadobacter sp.]|nr:hypothetical protein [Dyadobacter sp.]